MTTDDFVAALARAIDGDSEAMSQVLLEYDPLFLRLARIDGRLDEDCYQYIRLRAFEMTRRYKIPQEKIFEKWKKMRIICHYPYEDIPHLEKQAAMPHIHPSTHPLSGERLSLRIGNPEPRVHKRGWLPCPP